MQMTYRLPVYFGKKTLTAYKTNREREQKLKFSPCKGTLYLFQQGWAMQTFIETFTNGQSVPISLLPGDQHIGSPITLSGTYLCASSRDQTYHAHTMSTEMTFSTLG